jgi:hypothetical protein
MKQCKATEIKHMAVLYKKWTREKL